ASPSHTYATAGTYNVCLIVADGCSNDTICNNVTVTCPALTAGFSNSPSALTVAFTNTSAGTPTTYAWTFGDGGTSSLQNPSHTYITAGTYNVCLIVADACSAD